MLNPIRLLLICGALLATLGSPASAGGEIVGVASVIDADTIEIHGERMRLYGIDAPESCQTCTDTSGQIWRCGQRAALALQDLIGRRTVSCQQRDIDRYGRIVAQCRHGDIDIGEWLVGQGLALAYRRYSKAYVPPRRPPPLPSAACGSARSRLPGIGAESTARVDEGGNLPVTINL